MAAGASPAISSFHHATQSEFQSRASQLEGAHDTHYDFFLGSSCVTRDDIWSPLMDWVISRTEEATGRVRETHFATETSFHAALKDMFSDVGTRFLSAELPGGRVLDEDAARELVGAPHGSSWQ